ncbi:MAG: DUF4124 domain-containing protein [bacterium]|nr:DUF4124 domain-containing protein [bacterium]
MYQGLIRVVLLLVASSVWADEVYRWQDASGKWHFGGLQSAPAYAEPFVAMAPLSVIKTEVIKVDKPAIYEHIAVPDKPRNGLKIKVSRSRGRTEKIPDIDDREHHRVYCDKWRERLYRSRLGLLDHENQSAYERECILKVHW